MITKRERAVLQPALIYGWDIEYDGRGNAKWDGDTTMPFRGHQTAKVLVEKGLLETTIAPYRYLRSTWRAKDYLCRAVGCQRESCAACDGTGVVLHPTASQEPQS